MCFLFPGTSLFLLKERVDLIEYIAMISPTRSKFVFRQPKLSYVTNVYTLPFDSKVWYSTVILTVLMALALYGLMKWEHAKNHFLLEKVGQSQPFKRHVKKLVGFRVWPLEGAKVKQN